MGIFLLVVVVVFCHKTTTLKKHQAETEDKPLGPTTVFLQRSCFDSKLNKNTCSNIPSQVSVCPISCTSSILSDFKNSLDCNFFEGSAIPEHSRFSTFNPKSVQGHRKAVTICSVAPNLPPPPSSNFPDSDSIQKLNWEIDWYNKVVVLDHCLSKKPLKERPFYLYSIPESLSEVQSLSSFHSELCDDNGYL